jgi:hypothetical protein
MLLIGFARIGVMRAFEVRLFQEAEPEEDVFDRFTARM